MPFLNMNAIKTLVALLFAAALLSGTSLGAEKSKLKLTCCQQAAEKGKECSHKCCVSAHRAGKSCEKCNPGKEDSKLLESKKAAKKA